MGSSFSTAVHICLESRDAGVGDLARVGRGAVSRPAAASLQNMNHRISTIPPFPVHSRAEVIQRVKEKKCGCCFTSTFQVSHKIYFSSKANYTLKGNLGILG